MKVADIMQRQIVTVAPSAPLQEVGKIIFGLQIAGVPVVKGKKLLGLITQTDILRKLYPSYQEFMEDYVHAKDFEAMEQVSDKILGLTAKDIMNKNVTTVPPETPVMKVQSLMLTKGFGRVPVVDKRENLLGIVSQGDIFRAVVGQKLPFEGDEEFHDWLSRHYDLIIDWKSRLAKEIPDLIGLFKKESVARILDVGCGTGLHSIALAEEGFQVIGLDRSSRMIYEANEKAKVLAPALRQRLEFINHEYRNLHQVIDGKFDAAIFMGTGLAHDPYPAELLEVINKILSKKAVIICQITNFDKVIDINKRLFDFNLRPSHFTYEREHAFLRFYDPKEDGLYTLNVCVFDRGAKKWTLKGMHSVSVTPLDSKKMTALLKKIGFSKITFYGGEGGFYYDHLFRKPFNPTQSDQLIVVAKRG